jgi:light-regulated signal transduction histidine kinase (bacteriophytochrome)
MQEPLRKVMSFGGMLEQNYRGVLGEKGRDYLDRMLNATERMQNLLRSLLDYSRVTTKAAPFSRVDLAGIVREVLSDLEVTIGNSGGKIRVGELPTIEADPSQMRQLFQNLIGNALKFRKRDEKPAVEVQCASPPGGIVEITVTDNGIGFEEKYLDKIFAPFQRLHGRSEYEGTGIGLAICKKIVERHGGLLKAQSAVGKGSIFTVKIPKRQSESK